MMYVFTQGQGKKYKTDFNTDVLVRREPVRNDHYYTDLFSLECLHTGYITARYVNRRKYESKYDMISKVVAEYWIYGEYCDGFSTPRIAFFTAEEADDICRLRQAGSSENLKWGRPDLKLGEFKFLEFLDCKHAHRNTDLQVRLSEPVLSTTTCWDQVQECQVFTKCQKVTVQSSLQGDVIHFLGPHDRIGKGYITGIFGKEYMVVHSGT